VGAGNLSSCMYPATCPSMDASMTMDQCMHSCAPCLCSMCATSFQRRHPVSALSMHNHWPYAERCEKTVKRFVTLRMMEKLQLKSRMCRTFDPEAFSVEECQKAISAVFKSKASVSRGSKMFNVSPPLLQPSVLLHARTHARTYGIRLNAHGVHEHSAFFVAVTKIDMHPCVASARVLATSAHPQTHF